MARWRCDFCGDDTQASVRVQGRSICLRCNQDLYECDGGFKKWFGKRKR